MEKTTNILINFLFILFDLCESLPEVAAEKTAIAIRRAFDLLYPKEFNHVVLRKEWTIKYCSFLRDSLDEIIQEVKHEKQHPYPRNFKH